MNITDNEKNLKLSNLHLGDLKKSGLTTETILEADIKAVSPDLINKRLGFNIPGLSSMYQIPYPDTDYCRYKVFYEEGQGIYKDGRKKPKYLTRKDVGNRLYIPRKVACIIDDLTIPFYITEGEKKALKATQDGLFCLAIPGLWNWKVKDEYKLIPDFDQIPLDGRTIYLVPDNDWLEPDRQGENKNLIQAVYEFAYLLIDRGAEVSWVELPVGEL